MSKVTTAGQASTEADDAPTIGAGPTAAPGLPAQRTAGSQASPVVPRIEAGACPPPLLPQGAVPGRPWQFIVDSSGVTVETAAGSVATARVVEREGEVVIEFWTARFGLPDELSDQLVRRAFEHPAVRAGRPILLCVPRGDSEVLTRARRLVREPSAHVAGVTCLIHGRVRGYGAGARAAPRAPARDDALLSRPGSWPSAR